MSRKGNKLAGYKAVLAAIASSTQRWAFEQRRQIECRKSVKNDYFMRCVCIY